MNKLVDGHMDRWMYGQTYIWMNGHMDKYGEYKNTDGKTNRLD